MEPEVLIVFVDSLPYALLPRMERLREAPQHWPLRPGFGYSVNIHAEMFAGLLPDEVGYFGEWAYDPPRAPGWRYRALLPLLDALFHPYVLNRGLQALLTRRYHPGTIVPNIPLRHLDKFALTGVHLLDDPAAFPHPSIFTAYPSLRFMPIPAQPKGERDAAAVEQAMAWLEEGTPALFVPLPDLDGFGHRYGIEAAPYLEYLDRLDRWLAAMVERFLARHPRGHVFIVSDHGMVTVERGLRLTLEQAVGRASRRTYVYFSDANILRVWVEDAALREPIRAYLERFEGGSLVTEAERREYGITDRRFGDFIFVLEEGLAFEPSTFARHKPKGMHGYHPEAPGQQAVLLHWGPPWEGEPPRRMRDLHRMLVAALEGTW